MNEHVLPAIAFLEMGLMGAPMAARLLAAGYPVTVWSRDATKSGPLVSFGAQFACTAGGAGKGAAMVVTMLASGDAVVEVVKSAPDAATPATLWIDMSSTA